MVPAGAGLVAPAPAGPPQVEGEAGVADEAGGVLPGQACQAGGLGDGELDRGDAGRAGLAGPGGDRRVAEGDAQFSGALLLLLLLCLLLLLLLLLLHGPHGIFNLSRVIPDLAVKKWISPVGRPRGLDPFLTLIRARLQDYKVQGISAIVGKQPRGNVIISVEKDQLPERKRLFWHPTKSGGTLTSRPDQILWTLDFLLHTLPM